MTSRSGAVPVLPARGQQAVRIDDRGRPGSTSTCRPPRCSRCSDPTARARPPRSRCARASSSPTPARSRSSDWIPSPTTPRLRERIGVMLQGGGGYPAARAGEMLDLVAAYAAEPARPALADRHAGPDRVCPHHLPAAVRRTAAAAGAGVRRRRPPRAGVPRRADGGHGRARPNRGVGVDRWAAPRRRHRGADHPPADRGRGAGRPDRDHRPRRRGCHRHSRRTDAQRRGEPAAVPRAAECSICRC